MVGLFDLEWRLDEIAQYASWFSRPHSGSRDDQVAWDGLHTSSTGPIGTARRDVGGNLSWVVGVEGACGCGCSR